MKLLVREQVKTLLAQEGVKLKELAVMLSDKKGKRCLPNNLSQKLSNGTLSYNDMLIIAELLGYQIEFKKVEEV